MSDPVWRARCSGARSVGVEVSIDDFGTGYSSLAYLTDLPVSEVKIDRSFVTRMAPGSREEIIVDLTIDLGHHLGLRASPKASRTRPSSNSSANSNAT